MSRLRPASGGRARVSSVVRASAFVVVLLSIPGIARADDPPQGEERDYQVDPATGHPFRVRFNPARRFSIGLGAAIEPLSSAPAKPAFEATIGLSVRSIYTFGQGPGLILWNIEHRILSGFLWPFRRMDAGAPVMDAALYSVSLHRHDEAPSAVLPFTPPVSVPFPFDIGFEAEVGRVFIPSALPESAAGGSLLPMVRIGVMRASAFLDPLRSVTPGRSIEIGVGARYDVDPTAKSASGGLGDVRMVHRIAPMTATSLRLRFQSEDGLNVLDLRGDFIPHWTSEQTWKIMALASGRLERTLLAINDEPIDLVLEGTYRRSPETETTRVVDDVRVSLGLTFNVQIP